MEPVSDREAARQLLLARLLVPSKHPPTPAVLRTQLTPFFLHRLTNAEWKTLFESALASLIDEQLVSRKPLALTDAGRTRALEWLGMTQVPPRLKWTTLKNAWLVPRLLGADVAAARERDRLKTSDGLRSYLLKREHALPLEGCPTLKQSVDALVWKQLGIETDRPLTRNALVEEIVGRMLDVKGRLALPKLQEQLAAKAIGASQTKADELRLAAIRRWIDAALPAPAEVAAIDESSLPPAPSSDGRDLEGFAEAVHIAVRTSRTGRFGPNKMFINHVWEQLASQPRFQSQDVAAFKDRLVEANRVGLVALSRADLVEAMDPADVTASETRCRNAVFHFVQIPDERPATSRVAVESDST